MCGVASGWTVITSAPAFANASTCRSGRSTIRWQSRIPPRSWTRSRSASTISEPIVIGGTKCPSITSTCITRAPASITVDTCSARAARSRTRAATARSRRAGSRRGSLPRPSKARLAVGAVDELEEELDRGPRRHRRRVERVPLPLAAVRPRTRSSASVPGVELLLDRDARLERDAEPEPHRLLDRAVRAERQRLRAQVVVGAGTRPRAAACPSPARACSQTRSRELLAARTGLGAGERRRPGAAISAISLSRNAPPGDALVLGRPPGDRDVDLVLEHALEQRVARFATSSERWISGCMPANARSSDGTTYSAAVATATIRRLRIERSAASRAACRPCSTGRARRPRRAGTPARRRSARPRARPARSGRRRARARAPRRRRRSTAG